MSLVGIPANAGHVFPDVPFALGVGGVCPALFLSPDGPGDSLEFPGGFVFECVDLVPVHCLGYVIYNCAGSHPATAGRAIDRDPRPGLRKRVKCSP